MLKLTPKVLALTFMFLTLLQGTSYAYLDPGSGSLIVQMIIAGAAGIAFAAKIFWHRVKQVFSFLSRGGSNE